MHYKRICVGHFLITGLWLILLVSPAYGKALVLKLGHVNAPESPIGQGITYFSDLVKYRSQGECSIKVFPGGQLGWSRDLLEAVKQGHLDLAVITTSALTPYVKQAGVLELPFIFLTYREADRFLESNAGKSILQLLSNVGVVGLSYYEEGIQGVASRNKAVKKLQDYKGLRIRISSPQIVSSSIKLLGATPISMPLPEAYHALERGVVDSTLTTIFHFDQAKYGEILSFFSLTNQFYISQTLIINKAKLAQLPEKIRQIILESAFESSIYQKQLSRKVEIEILLKLEGSRVQIIRDPDKDGLKKASLSIYEKFAAIWKGIDCSKCPLPPWCCD